MKTCTKCGEGKPIKDFPVDRGKSVAQCRPCRNSVVKAWRERNQPKCQSYRLSRPIGYGYASHLKRAYELSMDEFISMLQEQDYKCKVCDKPITVVGKRQHNSIVVDHNHSTNEVRGLLCRNCNSMLGLAQDSAAILIKGAAYLEATNT